MKIFAVDIGNTNLHIGLYQNGEISDKLVIRHNGFKDFSESLGKIKTWVESKSEYSIKNVSICSVFAPAKPILDEIFAGFDILWVSSDMRISDLRLNYSPDSSLGADRFSNLVAFRTRFKKAGIIIDIGSALTADMIDAKGNFIGGIIIPGPNLSIKALQKETDKLPGIKILYSNKQWGNSTEECINCGIWFSYKAIIRDLIERAKQSLGSQDIIVVATGGFDLFWKTDKNLKESYFIDQYDPDFTLKGTGDIYFFCEKH